MIPTPDLGQVIYYRAQKEIPVGNPPVVITANTLFALYHTAKNKFMLITPKTQQNIDGLQAQDLAQSGDFVKKEMGEAKMTKKKGLLEQLLFEAESAIAASETDPVVVQDVSLDQKVDKYLVRYEREAIPTSAMYDVDMGTQANVNAANQGPGMAGTAGGPAPAPNESRKPKSGLLEALLFEAPEDEDPAAAEGGFGGGDPGADLAGGDPAADPTADPGAGAGPKSPPVIDTPKMNLNSYCRAVARLIQNYEALLDPKTTIFNRAKEYIRVNYDEATAKMFEEVMEQQMGVNPNPPERDASMAPHAGNAIYSGGGGGGG